MATWCDCEAGPRCQSGHCVRPAEVSAMRLVDYKHPVRIVPRFFCRPCYDAIVAIDSKPMKGIDRPEGADDRWRPSLMDHLRFAEMDIAFEERRLKGEALDAMGDFRRPGDERFTPAQLRSMLAWRRGLARMRDQETAGRARR